MLRLTRTLLIAGNILNWMAGISALLIVILSFVAPDYLSDSFTYGKEYPHYNAEQLNLLYFIDMLDIAIVSISVPFIHIILTRFIKMIDDLNRGLIFNKENSDRLKTVGWSLLAVQMTELIYGWLWFKWVLLFESEHGWGPAAHFLGWFAVLLIFVLAEIFKQGAIMREDLEGTI